MADKKITDLSARTDFDSTCLVPVDDASQTWRVSGQQIRNYIAPLTTRGDILIAAASGVASRLALGIKGKLLRSDGTDLVWGYKHAVIAAKSSAYSVADGDEILTGDSSGAAFQFTLPAAASGYTGRTIFFKKTDTSFNAITISDGTFSTTLNTRNESVEIYCDGTVWALLRRTIESIWTAYTPVSSWTSNTTPSGYWKRIGDSAVFRHRVVLSGAPTSTQLTMAVPSGLTINTTAMSTYQNGSYGNVIANDNAVDQYDCRVGIASTTTFGLYAKRTQGGSNPVHIDFPALTQAEPISSIGNLDTIEIEVSTPIAITGWNG